MVCEFLIIFHCVLESKGKSEEKMCYCSFLYSQYNEEIPKYFDFHFYHLKSKFTIIL